VGGWMIDLIELNETPYIEINFTTGYIFLAYNPSNHIIFVKFTKTKDTESTTIILDEMLNYLDKNNQEIFYATMDEGGEFLGSFAERL
jgi:transposase-like protein